MKNPKPTKRATKISAKSEKRESEEQEKKF